MRRLLAWMLLLLWLPVCALAAPDTPYAPETVVQGMALSDGALQALDVLYPAIRRCEETIALPPNTRYDDANAAMRCLTHNYPELFHLGNSWSVVYPQNAPELATAVMPVYTMSAAAYETRLAQLMEAAQALVSMTSGGTADRAEALHDLLCGATAYDGDEESEADNTAAGALLVGITRCEGYAQGLSLLYRLAGIPCGVVIGEAGTEPENPRHAWNVAVIDGVLTLIDPTWNDQEESGSITHWYYGLTTDMMAADHFPDPDFAVPACTSLAVNWHARRGLLVSDDAGVYGALRRFAREGEVSIRFADEAMYRDFNERTNDWLSDYNATVEPGEAFYGHYWIVFSDEQRCVRLERTEGTP